ncbi:MAG: hypothetical protein GY704_12690, partial [Phycisphaeraceae bacterium]|nr:hypothetical protein [Phycisphaeraceae bacterium]
MSTTSHFPPHGVVGRHEETFNDVLYAQPRKTPWWLISIGIHAIVIIGLWSMEFSAGTD